MVARIGRRLGPAVMVACAGLSLAACSVFEPPPPPQPCPSFATVADARTLTRFVGTGHDLTDVDFAVAVGQIQGQCSYSTKGRVSMTLRIPFIAERGPANRDCSWSRSNVAANCYLVKGSGCFRALQK